MDERLHQSLLTIAIVLTVAWVAWALYDGLLVKRTAGDRSLAAADRYFEDGYYDKALRAYEDALQIDPDRLDARRGKARSLMQLGHNEEALANFDKVIERAPGFGPSYANRGILYDRMGNYTAAVNDYVRALELDPSLAKGPHWLTRLVRNQPQRPTTVADRVRYLKEQLAKPVSERLLNAPEKDAEQRPHKR